jgi:hypothetical protein
LEKTFPMVGKNGAIFPMIGKNFRRKWRAMGAQGKTQRTQRV